MSSDPTPVYKASKDSATIKLCRLLLAAVPLVPPVQDSVWFIACRAISTSASARRLPEALRAWLDDSDGYYLNRRRVPPASAAVLLADGLRAATVYE